MAKSKKEEKPKKAEKKLKVDESNTTVTDHSTGSFIVTTTGADGSWKQSIEPVNPLEEEDNE